MGASAFLPLLGLASFVAVLTCASTRAGAGPDEVGILVLKEHGVGSPTLAQPYVDRFVRLAAERNRWSAAKGQYLTSRKLAESFIETEKPHYAILSLAAFLALRKSGRFVVIGRVASSLAGGRQYFLVSKQAADLRGCRGAKLASDHLDDMRFIERVVAGSQFRLGDFTLVQNQRPLQSIRQLIAGEVRCALVDDAQLAGLPHLEGADGIHAVWESALLPPMAVVGLPAAPASERETFKKSLEQVCTSDGQSGCAEVGISSLGAASDGDYAAVVAAYGD